MSLVNLVRSAAFSVALGVGSLYVLGCDASSGSTQYCASDKDCKGDRLCVKGVCEGSGSQFDGKSSLGSTCYDVGQIQLSCLNQSGWGDSKNLGQDYALQVSQLCEKKVATGTIDQVCINCVVSAPCSPEAKETPLDYCVKQSICKN